MKINFEEIKEMSPPLSFHPVNYVTFEGVCSSLKKGEKND
jgi:hypothetical protein